MKIAVTHLRHAMTGGTEQFLNQITDALIKRGHDVTIICRTHEESHNPDINFVSLRSWALGRGHRLWRFATDVEKHLAHNAYDIVFGLGRTWSQDVVRVGAGLYRDQIRKGLGRNRYWPRDLIAQAIERRTFAPGNYTKVIANSYLTEASLTSAYGIPESSIVTIHNAVDTDKFNDSYRLTAGNNLRQECGFSAENKVYLFLGSGFRRKGLDRLLNAFPIILAKAPESRLMIVGNDSNQAKYEQQAKLLGINAQVKFLGKRSDAEVCYNAADIYLMPTRFDAFGYSAIEALACGLPVVITDTAGAAEVMPDHMCKVIHDSEADQNDKFAQIILSLDADAREAGIRQTAIKHASKYALSSTIGKIVSLLEQTAQELAEQKE